MREVILTRELLQEEAASILRSVHDNAAAGRSNKLGDVKESLESKVTLDFDDYFLFLRKFSLVVLDREQGALGLTADGERILSCTAPGILEAAVEQFFGSRLGDEVVREDPTETLPRRPPPLNAPEVPEGRRPPPPVPLPLTTVAPPAALKADKAVEARAAEARGSELDLRYVKYESLGGGAMATVFRGKQTGLGVDVAIKELRDIFAYFSFLQRGEVIKRLKKELCAQAQLRHPGVVAILDQNCEVARPYYVLELCSGGSLRQRLESLAGKPLPVNEALRHFLQICYALRVAHQAGVLHQNLKPENVLFDHLGNAKLADFGLARVLETENPQKQMPQVFMGTGGMGYLPPEQLTAKKEFGPESDLYMLGLVLYEMLTGQLPGRRSPLPSAANSAVPAKIDPIFDRMTQDRRETRYPSVDALLDDFYAAFSDGRFLHKGDLVLSSGASAEPAAAEGDAEKEKGGGKDKERKAS